MAKLIEQLKQRAESLIDAMILWLPKFYFKPTHPKEICSGLKIFLS